MFVKRDGSDEMFFSDYLDSSEVLQDKVVKGQERNYMFPDLAVDLFSLFYKANPENEQGKIPQGLSLAKQALDQVRECREFQDLRNLSRLDPFASGFATQAMADTLSKYLPPIGPKSPEDIQAEIDAFKDLLGQSPKLDGEINKRVKQGEKTLTDIGQKTLKADTLKINEDDLRGIIRGALQQAAKDVSEALDGLSAVGQGAEAANPSAANLHEKIAVSKRLKNSPKLAEILRQAGKLQRIARKKQSEKMTSTELSSVEVGDAIPRLVGSEYGKLSHPALKGLFYKGLIEKTLMQYKLESKEPQGQGPIVVCVDSSGSMSGAREIASKGIALAMLEIARLQKRGFVLIQFAGAGSISEFIAPKGECATMDLLSELETFLNGGTDFQCPLDRALYHIDSQVFRKSDVIFITDGECSVSPAYLETLKAKKAEKTISIFGIAVGTSGESLKGFCDEMWDTEDLLQATEATDRVFSI